MIAAPFLRCGRAAWVRIEHREDVGLEGALQLLLGDVGDVLVGMLLAGIVDEDVEPAERRRPPWRPPRRRTSLSPRSPAMVIALRALLLDDLAGLLGVVMLAQIEDRDVGALAGEQHRDRPADAAVGAGDQRDLALEPAGSRIARLPVGLGLELALVPGQRIFVDHRLGGVGHRGYLLCPRQRPTPTAFPSAARIPAAVRRFLGGSATVAGGRSCRAPSSRGTASS